MKPQSKSKRLLGGKKALKFDIFKKYRKNILNLIRNQ